MINPQHPPVLPSELHWSTAYTQINGSQIKEQDSIYGPAARPIDPVTGEITTSVYLAGKIAHNDWRPTHAEPPYNARTEWPPMYWRGLRITGPFFADCGHGEGHNQGTHAVADLNTSFADHTPEAEQEKREIRHDVKRLCLNAIRESDVVFAWFDEGPCTAYGTLFELGYANALGKTVIIAHSYLNIHDDLWFSFTSANSIITHFDNASGALDLLTMKYAPHPPLDSPIERKFWDHWRRITAFSNLLTLWPQVDVTASTGNKYRIDFAVPGYKLGVELMGATYHTGTEYFEKDKQRKRELERDGWEFREFTAQMVAHDIGGVVADVARFLNRHMGLWTPAIGA